MIVQGRLFGMSSLRVHVDLFKSLHFHLIYNPNMSSTAGLASSADLKHRIAMGEL